MKKFWNMKVNAATGEGELYLYGDISSVSWWGDEVTPQTFKNDLDALGDVSVLNVFINSNGGDVFAGHAIHSMLKRHKAKVVITVDGLAASIASVICTAGDEVRMYRNTMQMVHEPWTFAVGNASDMRKMADDLDKISESLVAAYEDKTGLPRDEIKAIMAAETWLTADECKEKGFCDVVLAEKKVSASISGDILAMNGQNFDLSRFHNRPKVEAVAQLPTQTPIVKDELPTATFAVRDDKYIVMVDGKDVGTFAVSDELISVLAAGKTISQKNMDKLQKSCDMMAEMQTMMDDMKSKMAECMGMVEEVMDDGKENDGDPDDGANNKKKDDMMDPNDPDHDPMHEPDGDPDDKCDPKKDSVDALTAKVDALMMKFDAMQASISNAVTNMRSVENDVKPSPKSEDDIVSLKEEHVIDIVDEPAENEVNIEAESLTQSIKAAIDEKMAEFRLYNMGKVD